jgi:hypothetical protein
VFLIAFRKLLPSCSCPEYQGSNPLAHKTSGRKNAIGVYLCFPLASSIVELELKKVLKIRMF